MSLVGKNNIIPEVPIDEIKRTPRKDLVSLLEFTGEVKDEKKQEIIYGFEWLRAKNKEYQGEIIINFPKKEIKVNSTPAPGIHVATSNIDYLPHYQIQNEVLSGLYDFLKAPEYEPKQYQEGRVVTERPETIFEPVELEMGKERIIKRWEEWQNLGDFRSLVSKLFNSLDQQERRVLGLSDQLGGDMIFNLYRKRIEGPVLTFRYQDLFKYQSLIQGHLNSGEAFLVPKGCYITREILELSPGPRKRPHWARQQTKGVFTDFIIKPGSKVNREIRDSYLTIQRKMLKREALLPAEIEVVIIMSQMVNQFRPLPPEYFRQLKDYPITT